MFHFSPRAQVISGRSVTPPSSRTFPKPVRDACAECQTAGADHVRPPTKSTLPPNVWIRAERVASVVTFKLGRADCLGDDAVRPEVSRLVHRSHLGSLPDDARKLVIDPVTRCWFYCRSQPHVTCVERTVFDTLCHVTGISNVSTWTRVTDTASAAALGHNNWAIRSRSLGAVGEFGGFENTVFGNTVSVGDRVNFKNWVMIFPVPVAARCLARYLVAFTQCPRSSRVRGGPGRAIERSLNDMSSRGEA
jgi:hypothetical protein